MFGDILSRLREEKGWSQAKLAERSGVSRVQIAKLETDGRLSPNWRTVQKLAKALRVKCTAFVES